MVPYLLKCHQLQQRLPPRSIKLYVPYVLIFHLYIFLSYKCSNLLLYFSSFFNMVQTLQNMVKKLAEITTMNLEFSEQCLAKNSWSYEQALVNFQELRVCPPLPLPSLPSLPSPPSLPPPPSLPLSLSPPPSLPLWYCDLLFPAGQQPNTTSSICKIDKKKKGKKKNQTTNKKSQQENNNNKQLQQETTRRDDKRQQETTRDNKRQQETTR